MKKISSVFKNNHEYILRPFALVNHEHTEYLQKDVASNSANGSIDFQIAAGENISALKVLASNGAGAAIFADKDTTGHEFSLLGISTTAGLTGEQIFIRRSGLLKDAGAWSWNVNSPIYLGSAGVLTQTVPTSGFTAILGWPTDVDTIFINIDRTITLL